MLNFFAFVFAGMSVDAIAFLAGFEALVAGARTIGAIDLAMRAYITAFRIIIIVLPFTLQVVNRKLEDFLFLRPSDFAVWEVLGYNSLSDAFL